LLPRYLDADAYTVVEGGVPETTALLAERWDHIFYTGNGTVGRVVMAAAAQHLTPVTLELGGKTPVIVDVSADLDVAARRIVWGKYLNAGQTCIAPDYVLVDRRVEAPLLARMTDAVHAFYGPDARASADLGRIVNERHFDRLARLADAEGAGDVVFGGDRDRSSRYYAPTALRGTDATAPIMQEEIFGPLLPTLPVDDLDDAFQFVTARDKPLALYVFAEDEAVQAEVLDRTTSGGVCVNATLFHITVPGLPFGGVGESGMGAYHGRATFDTFTHRKSVLARPTRIDPSIAYPPYTPLKAKLLRKLL
jgi:aldehyde dehydrogenase (NAD+)